MEHLQAEVAELKSDCDKIIAKLEGLELKIKRVSESEQAQAGPEGSKQPGKGMKGAEKSMVIDLEGSEGSE